MKVMSEELIDNKDPWKPWSLEKIVHEWDVRRNNPSEAFKATQQQTLDDTIQLFFLCKNISCNFMQNVYASFLLTS